MTSSAAGSPVARGSAAARCTALALCLATSVPSIRETMRSSLPRAVSVTPTVDAIAQHRGPVAQGRHFGHAMRDEDHRMPALAPAAHHREDFFGHVRGQRGGDLVEQQDLGIGGERPRKIDEPEDRLRQVAHEGREIDALDPHLGQPVEHDRQGHAGQPHVLGERQVRHQRRVLIDRDDAGAARLRGRAEFSGFAGQDDGAGIARKHPGDDLHQRALAGPVGAHQGMDLAGPHLESSRPQRHDGAEALRDVTDFEQGRACHSCSLAAARMPRRTAASSRANGEAIQTSRMLDCFASLAMTVTFRPRGLCKRAAAPWCRSCRTARNNPCCSRGRAWDRSSSSDWPGSRASCCPRPQA